MKRLIRKVITKIKEGYLKEIYRETLWMYQYAKKYWLSICFYIFAGVLGTFMGLGTSVASKYLIDAVEKGWAKGWRARGWVKADKKPALNSDLWERLLGLLEIHEVRFVWVKGHNEHPENERCDRMAVAESKKF